MLFRSMLAVSLRRYDFFFFYYYFFFLSVLVVTLRRDDLLMCNQTHQMNNTCCLFLPQQVMWNAAVHAEYLHDHNDYGFDVGNVRFSWE